MKENISPQLAEQRQILRDCLKRAGGAVMTHYFANGDITFIGPGGLASNQRLLLGLDFRPQIFSCFEEYDPGETSVPLTLAIIRDSLNGTLADPPVCREDDAIRYVATKKRAMRAALRVKR